MTKTRDELYMGSVEVMAMGSNGVKSFFDIFFDHGHICSDVIIREGARRDGSDVLLDWI